MDFSDFYKTLKADLDSYLEKNFVVNKKTKSYQFVINDSVITFLDNLFTVRHKNKVVADKILSYEIALAIAENPMLSKVLIPVDNQYSKHYNDMVFYLNSFKSSTDLNKDSLISRYQESVLSLNQIKKTIRAKSRTLKFKQINN